MVLGQTTPRVLRSPLSTGLPPRDSLWSLTFHVTSSLDVASTTSVPVCSFVLLDSIGTISSAYLLSYPVATYLNNSRSEWRRNSWMVKSKWRGTSGHFSCTPITRTIKRIRGMGSCVAVYSYPWVFQHLSSWCRDDYSLRLIGLQAHIHFTQLSRPRTQSNAFRECTHSWHARRYQGITCLYRNSGMFDRWDSLYSPY